MCQLFNHDKLTIANQLKMGQNQSGVIASEQQLLQQIAAAKKPPTNCVWAVLDEAFK